MIWSGISLRKKLNNYKSSNKGFLKRVGFKQEPGYKYKKGLGEIQALTQVGMFVLYVLVQRFLGRNLSL